ncbi:3-oxoacyl-ACP synthase III family protein [Gelidibacter mesophilus]|uniref:3-oxoacyl-ACP synthase III family protein n=1 Tax=Gelidibacter mesophilus TaxID=169050 RepID=UPI0004193036|nr:ketoacyl-ACP synthase III [Gelidibacter mesophilus]
MTKSTIKNIKIAGVSVALPTQKVEVKSYTETFGEDIIRKFIETTGVESVCRSIPEQTASDLGYEAALNLFQNTEIKKEEIGILVFISQKPDFRTPASSYLIHNRLELSKDCLCLDINLACSGFIVALHSIHTLLQNSDAQKALLITADTSHKTLSPFDRTMIMLFGDSGSALLLEKTKENVEAHFTIKSDGKRFKSIITPSGAYRNLDAPKQRVVWSDGILRSDYDTHMKGMDVFEFSLTDVPKLFKTFLKELDKTPADYDYFTLHQANHYILKQLSRKIKIPMEKIPISLDRFGNNSSNSVPLVLADHFSNLEPQTLKLFMSGFGAGLSWACADITIDSDVILPIVYTDAYDNLT